jgi:biofilm PGA synthesis N-glycosyltransferase PgaC
MDIVDWVFLVACLSIVYIYAGYPVLLGLLAARAPRPVRKEPNHLTCSVLMVSYNEGERLAAKIDNLRTLDGQERIREVLIGLDGATEPPDCARVAAQGDPRIRFIPFPERGGKPAALSHLIAMAKQEILIMVDVRQRMAADAIEVLSAYFSDPAVQVVSGELVFERDTSDSAAAGGIDAYWRLEKWLRRRESITGSVPGATGALYAIRRSRAHPIPPDTALDDVLIPMLAIRDGGRCLFAPEARIYDRPSQDAATEAIRKRRTLAGVVQLLLRHPAWVLPGGHPLWWRFASHKIARLFSPGLLVLVLAICVHRRSYDVYAVLLIIQTMFYSLGIMGRLGGTTTRKLRIFGWPSVFLMLQQSLTLAWIDGLRGGNLAIWRRAPTPS